MQKDFEYMQIALQEAQLASQEDEVPIGAVLVADSGQILARTHNQTISLNDPTAHAEILALRISAEKVCNYRLLGSILYVTIEPCIMCMGAIIHARVSRLVFGAPDPKWGAAGSLYDLSKDARLNHQIEVSAGLLADESRDLMQGFFRNKRKKGN